MQKEKIIQTKTQFQLNMAYLRKCLNFTHPQMAELLKINQKTYEAWEYGINEPSLKVIIGFRCITNLTIDEMATVNLEATYSPMEILRKFVNTDKSRNLTSEKDVPVICDPQKPVVKHI